MRIAITVIKKIKEKRWTYVELKEELENYAKSKNRII